MFVTGDLGRGQGEVVAAPLGARPVWEDALPPATAAGGELVSLLWGPLLARQGLCPSSVGRAGRGTGVLVCKCRVSLAPISQPHVHRVLKPWVQSDLFLAGVWGSECVTAFPGPWSLAAGDGPTAGARTRPGECSALLLRHICN